MTGFLRFIDKYAGYLIVLILSLFRTSGKQPGGNRKFLVIKLWAIGDSILTLSLIRGIRESFKDSTVDVVLRTRVKDVFDCYETGAKYNLDSFADLVKLFRRFRCYDVVFDCEPYLNLSAILAFFSGKERIGFSGQFRSCLYTKTTGFRNDRHMLQNYLDMLRLLGKQFDIQRLEILSVGANDKVRVDAYISGNLRGQTLVGITPGISGSSRNRQWYEDRFAGLADRISALPGCTVIFIDGPENKKTVDKVISFMHHKPFNATGLFTLKESFYLISKCAIFISNDTGPMHIAAAQGCRTIGLFGPNTPVLWAPFGQGNTAIYKTKLPPAILNDKGIFREGNREGYMGCITVDDVYEAVLKCL